jgi:sodium/bile acid cotransporter 7
MSSSLRLPRWVDRYVLLLLATIALAGLFPVSGAAATAWSRVTTGAIALLFFLHGAKLSPKTAWEGLRRWQVHGLIFATTFVLFPLLGLALRFADPRLLPHELLTGVLFLCVLPSTVQSSIAFTSIARGNVATAVCAASMSNLVGVVLSPLLAALILGAAVHISAGSAVSILGELVLPFAAGQLARRLVAPVLTRHPRATSAVDRGSVLLVVYGAFSAGIVSGSLERLGTVTLVELLAVDGALLAVVLAATSLLARAARHPRGDRIVVVFCGSKKSLATGLPMATVLFPARSVSLVVLPLMIFHLVQLMVCAVLARRWGDEAAANDRAVRVVDATATPLPARA